MKYWEIIADNLHDAGWSLGWVSSFDSHGDQDCRWISKAPRYLTPFETDWALGCNHLVRQDVTGGDAAWDVASALVNIFLCRGLVLE